MSRCFVIALILLFVAQCPCYCNVWRNPERSGTFTVNEPIMTTGVTADGQPVDDLTVFSPTTSRIYCFVSIEGPESVRLGSRWYQEGELLYDSGLSEVGADRLIWWSMRTTAEEFEEGNYRVEIYAISAPIKVKYFTIRESK